MAGKIMENIQKYEAAKESLQLKKEEIETLVQAGVIPKGTPEAQIKLFARVCSEKNLSPFSRQIYLIPRNVMIQGKPETRYTIQSAIDGFRAIADRTGKYAGNDDYLFNDGLTEFAMVNNKLMQPTTATATVYKVVNNLRCPFTATARWDEYYPGDKLGFMWKKMPFLMLGKCAEALALRKAFPEVLGGIYTHEEMQQADLPISELPQTKKTPLQASKDVTEANKKQSKQKISLDNQERDYKVEAELCLTQEKPYLAFVELWKSIDSESKKWLEESGFVQEMKDKIIAHYLERIKEIKNPFELKNWKKKHSNEVTKLNNQSINDALKQKESEF
jgi:phage recombination protein Bet